MSAKLRSSGVFCKILVLLVFGVTLGCGPQEISPAPTTELEGTWQSECFKSADGTVYRETLRFSGNNMQKTTSGFLDENCVRLAYALNQAANFTIKEVVESAGEGVNTIDFYAVNSTLAVYDEATAKEFNQENRCGHAAWKVGEMVNVGGKTCFADVRLPVKGDRLFNIYQLKDGVLALGEAGAAEGRLVGRLKEAERPTTVGTRKYNRQ